MRRVLAEQSRHPQTRHTQQFAERVIETHRTTVSSIKFFLTLNSSSLHLHLITHLILIDTSCETLRDGKSSHSECPTRNLHQRRTTRAQHPHSRPPSPGSQKDQLDNSKRHRTMESRLERWHSLHPVHARDSTQPHGRQQRNRQGRINQTRPVHHEQNER